MNKELLEVLKDAAKKALNENTRFHDYAHALEVLANMELLLDKQSDYRVDVDSLYAAILFHDASNSSDSNKEGIEGSSIAINILKEVKAFPQEKLTDVSRLMLSINSPRISLQDEIIINTADAMAAFSDLGFIRSFMIYGSRNIKVKEALEDELAFINKRYNKLKLDSAKDIVQAAYEAKVTLLKDCLNIYQQ